METTQYNHCTRFLVHGISQSESQWLSAPAAEEEELIDHDPQAQLDREGHLANGHPDEKCCCLESTLW